VIVPTWFTRPPPPSLWLCICRLGLGLHSQLLTAGVRCVIQLSLLGHILVPIFNYGQLWLVLAYAAFMVWISAVEAIGRPARYYKVGRHPMRKHI
jgi:putative ABC transport system permease protein